MDKVVLFLSPYIDSNDIIYTAFSILVAIVTAFVGYLIYKWFSADHIDLPVHNHQIIEQDSAVQKKVKKSKLKSKAHVSQHVENQGPLFSLLVYGVHYGSLYLH